jgi:hypothetical protein
MDIVLDTSAVATDTIDYVATDPTGVAATSTRTIIVEPVVAPSSAPNDSATSTCCCDNPLEALIGRATRWRRSSGHPSYPVVKVASGHHTGQTPMFLPPQYAWFQPVLIASIVVFIIDLVGNSISFGNRFIGALVSAIVFAVVFGALVYFGYGSVSMSVVTTPSATAPAQLQK